MISWLYWDPSPEVFTIPGVEWPILWYGLLFALGFCLGFPLFVSILMRFFSQFPEGRKLDRLALKKKASAIADQLTLYMVIATVVGARLGHFLFYERPSDYRDNPMQFFRIWEGGLASHGAVLGILLGLFFFRMRIRKTVPLLGWTALLDLLSPPAALAACCIRIGNFFNQEILGKPTELPWAVIFGHPIDHSVPIPRHPVQLYEALFYLVLFFCLWRLTYIPRFLSSRGKLIGLFLISVFSFRFFAEFLKVEQSHLLPPHFPLTMGQLLSLPIVILGICFYVWRRRAGS